MIWDLFNTQINEDFEPYLISPNTMRVFCTINIYFAVKVTNQLAAHVSSFIFIYFIKERAIIKEHKLSALPCDTILLRIENMRLREQCDAGVVCARKEIWV